MFQAIRMGIAALLAATLTFAATARAGAATTPTTIDEPTVITEPGSYRVAADIDGGSQTAVAIDADNVTLDLGGHTLTAGLTSTAVEVRPNHRFVTITNGTVQECGIGVAILPGCRFVTVHGVHFAGLFFGINGAFGDTYQAALTANTFKGNLVAIQLQGDGHLLSSNKISTSESCHVVIGPGRDFRVVCNCLVNTHCSAIVGTDVSSSTFAYNTITQSELEGIVLGALVTGSNDNLIVNNKVSFNGTVGIRLDGASGNRVEGNVAYFNRGFDLFDLNLSSRINLWRRNLFSTDNEGNGPGKGWMQ